MNKQSLTEEELMRNSIMQEDWYHSIELLPGIFTKGADHKNVHLTRQLLKGCEIKNMNCLDIGAMDCLMTILLLRRGAKKVTAYDRLKASERRVNFLRKTLNLDFDYIVGMKLSDLREITKNLGFHPFDVVIFSGIIYHMFDPMAGLALARGMVRNGGLLMIETAAVMNNSMAMYLNAEGRFHKEHTSYWLISIECLDYLLRFFRLSAMDCIYFKTTFEKQTSLQLCRIGIVCRAVDEALSSHGDSWIDGHPRILDYKEFLNWEELRNNRPDVIYSTNDSKLIYRQDSGTVDLYKTVLASRERIANNVDEQIRLKLDTLF